MLPMAVLSVFAWHVDLPMSHQWAFVGHMWFMILMLVLATAEVCADKWKGMPNRTAPAGLLGRICMGAFAGSVLAASTEVRWWKGAAVCAFLAVLGAGVGYSLRQYFREATRADDMYIAVAEDFVTLIGSIWVLSHLG